ncbi:MAG: PHB depolymerase family esterase [Alphaproteobacteria bacterium]|nr:PHB depolymerase family esterase [Alphaproteobacteria bacterium]
MNNDFVAEILRATGFLRAGDPSGATAIIQAALAAGGLASSSTVQTGAGDGFRMPQHAERSTDGTVGPDRPGDARGDGHRSKAFRPRRLRKPLGEVLRTLAEGRKGLGLDSQRPGLGMPARKADLPLPEGAEFRDLHYTCAAGVRSYRLYVPTSACDGLQGLIVMLHGCTQSPEDFAAGTGMNDLAEEHRLLVVYPRQTNGDNSMSCWNWFRPGDQVRDAGEPAIIAGLTRSIRDEFGILHDRVFVAGLSAGGAMAAIMGETYPDLYAGIGIHSGLAYGSANDVLSAFSAMRGQAAIEPRRRAESDAAPRAIVFHGSTDTTVHPGNADRIVATLAGACGQVLRSEHASSGGKRGYSKTVIERGGGVRALECWIVDGARHAWSGGSPNGSYTDPRGPDASAAMVRFFLSGLSDSTGVHPDPPADTEALPADLGVRGFHIPDWTVL